MKLEKITIALLIITLAVIGFNAFMTRHVLAQQAITGQAVASIPNPADAAQIPESAGASVQELPDVLPKGVPAVYGQEIGVSFDDVTSDNPGTTQQAITKLAAYDQGITLGRDDLKRYASIAGQISCEYCCGAPAVVFSDGRAACGCQHSAVMRGVAKYLIKNHGKEYTDDQILEEMGKWKTLFFPGNIREKAAVLQKKNIELNYINLASNKYRGIEKNSEVQP